jgi:DNA-binding NarL/FixJ family response regulator
MLRERERIILELAAKGLSDYKIARQLQIDPPTVSRSRKNALQKLRKAEDELQWAKRLGYAKNPKLSLPETN